MAWYPRSRDAQLHMMRAWLAAFAEWAEPWNVPPTRVEQLAVGVERAEAALARVSSGTRSPVDVAACASAFADMEAEARFIRRRFLLAPPLRPEDLARLMLPQPDLTPTPVGPPTAQPAITVAYPGGPHLLRITLSPLAGSDPSDRRSGYGHAVFMGLMPPGGATAEQAAGAGRYLMREPKSGAKLSHLRFTRRSREFVEFVEFAGEESSMTAFFCARYENQKGERGPWGPVASAVVP